MTVYGLFAPPDAGLSPVYARDNQSLSTILTIVDLCGMELIVRPRAGRG